LDRHAFEAIFRLDNYRQEQPENQANQVRYTSFHRYIRLKKLKELQQNSREID